MSPAIRVFQRASPRLSVTPAPTPSPSWASSAGEAYTPSSKILPPLAASLGRGSRSGITAAALKGSSPISLTAVGARSTRTRVSITGATIATDSSLAIWLISASGTWPALSRGASTASGSPCTLFIACAKSASAAALIKWIA